RRSLMEIPFGRQGAYAPCTRNIAIGALKREQSQSLPQVGGCIKTMVRPLQAIEVPMILQGPFSRPGDAPVQCGPPACSAPSVGGPMPCLARVRIRFRVCAENNPDWADRPDRD